MDKENVNRRADRFKRRKVTLKLSLRSFVCVQLTIITCTVYTLERARAQPQIRKENYNLVEMHYSFPAMSALPTNCQAGKAIF